MFRIAFVALFLMSALPGAASARQALQNAPDRTLELEDVTLRYRDLGGGGEPVVLLHGYTNDLHTFDGVADSIAAEYRVIALDLRGFGKSRMRNGSARFGRSTAEDVIALLDALEISRAHVVGFSLGGVVAASVARAAPERVTSLTLLAPPLYVDSAAFARDLAPFVEDLANGRGVASFFQWVYPDAPADAIRRVAAYADSVNDAVVLREVARQMPALVPDAAELRRITVPTVIAVGTADRLLVQGRHAVEQLRHSRLIIVPDGNHGSTVRAPGWVAAFRTNTRLARTPARD